MICCGHCKGRHHRVETVRRCSRGEIFACGWLVPHAEYDQDGVRVDSVEDCGAAAWETDRGMQCEAGHEHVDAETRFAEGWDYADEGEARLRASYGHESRLMDGHIFMG